MPNTYKIITLQANAQEKGTSALLWSSTNFCSISQNMHYKAPVAAQHWKANKVVWTWKDDWPPQRNSTYKRPFTREGNYLVTFLIQPPILRYIKLLVIIQSEWLSENSGYGILP